MSLESREQYSEREDSSEEKASGEKLEAIKHIRSLIDLYGLHEVILEQPPATYENVAKVVGLKPVEEFRDVGHFELHRARIPNALFAKISQDIFRLAEVYQFPEFHKTEEATERLFSPIFNHLVARFGGLVTNEPSFLRGCVVGNKPIKYQYRSFGGLTVLFIVVKSLIGSLEDRLNTIAQVITESSACAKENKGNDLTAPVYAILCEGTCFQFFSFDGSTPTPTFRQGKLFTRVELPFPDMRAADEVDFLVHLRPICDVVFYIILTGYTASLDAFDSQFHRERGGAEGRDDSAAEWFEARGYLVSTMTKAKEAATLSKNGDIEGADITSTEAFRLLAASIDVTPWAKLVVDVEKVLADPRVIDA